MQNKHSKGVKECIVIILCTVNNQREGYTPILKQVCWLNSAQSAYTMQYTYSNCACMYIATCIATCMKSVPGIFRKDDLKK